MKSSAIKTTIPALLLIFLACGLIFTSCGSDSSAETVEVEIPTEGLITTVQEVATDQFKIENEETVADTADSRIIANYLDATSDTFTLQEARLMQSSGSGRQQSVVRSAGMGYFGFIMLGRMGGMTPRAGAYTSSSAHNKASNGAGKQMKNSANRVTRTRPSSGKSGYGSGKSTRSYGG